jgi:hypothetical protein
MEALSRELVLIESRLLESTAITAKSQPPDLLAVMTVDSGNLKTDFRPYITEPAVCPFDPENWPF